MLEFSLAGSEQVQQFAKIGQADSFESDGSEHGAKDDASAGSGPAVQVSTGQESDRSLDLNSVKPDEAEGEKEKGSA